MGRELLRNYGKKIKGRAVTLGRFMARNCRVVKYVFAAMVGEIFMTNKSPTRYNVEHILFFFFSSELFILIRTAFYSLRITSLSNFFEPLESVRTIELFDRA